MYRALGDLVLEAALLLSLAALALAQCPNNLAVYNPNVRTACVNATFFIVPVGTATVAAAVSPYPLLPLPTNNATLFPTGFPAGMRPVLVQIGTESDIRGSVLQIAELLTGQIAVPYVDRLGNGQTPFVFSIKQYVGGYDGDDITTLLPVLVSSLAGTPIQAATFVPDTAAYEEFSASPPEFMSEIKDVIVQNPTGANVILEAVDTDFFTAQTSPFTTNTFYEIVSQPLIVDTGLCQRNPIYFNQTFSDPTFRTGTVTLYSPGAAFAGVYDNVAALSASGESVGYMAESCQNAGAGV